LVGRSAPRVVASRLALIAFSLVVTLASAEAVCRSLDRYRILSVALTASGAPRRQVRDETPDRQYVLNMPRQPSVSVGWYVERPQSIPRIPLTPEMKARSEAYPTEPWAPFFEWNLAHVRAEACSPARDVVMGGLEDFYYFESKDGSRFPAYRHLRHVSPPGWFVTNNYGWRGPDIALNKPLNRIRIAFVGASTTIDAFGLPFSHPELVGYWLNRWASANGIPYSFDVINTGRSGIQSNSIAAIVKQELVPVEPDLVIYYEGANQLWPDRVVTLDDKRRYSPVRTTYRIRTVAENYSALVRRVGTALDRFEGRGGYEPRKPASHINWPAGVDERNPVLDLSKLPMDLPNIVACLDTIRTALRQIDSELVVSSFVWIVHDKMRLDPDRDANLHNYLNRTYWPYTYADMRRIADFQNRVFEKYARTHGLPFIDMAAEFPQDPALAIDAIHFRYPGIALQAWIFFQHLIPMIQERIADGRLPKPQKVTRSGHPAFDQPLRLTTLQELRARCQ
jgi:hypothetical protein